MLAGYWINVKLVQTEFFVFQMAVIELRVGQVLIWF